MGSQALAILDAQLGLTAYAGGDRFGMGDVPLGVTVARWSKLPIERRTHANVDRWFAEIRTRPAFRAHADVPLS